MQLIISNTSGIPIYQQIKEQIRDAILGGELQEGQMLPSLRQLAKELKISVLTITRAYTELEQEGYVTNMQGKGCFVMAHNSQLVREQLLCRIEEHIKECIQLAKRGQITQQELCKIITLLWEEIQ